jgi:hypothetical protein
LTAGQLITAYSLRPHPFEGHWREDAGRGRNQEGLQLLEAAEEAQWHKLGGLTVYELVEGGPLVVSVSEDGVNAAAVTLTRTGDSATLPPGAARALSCLGRVALFAVRWEEDHPVRDRVLMPDDWFPGPGEGDFGEAPE